MERRAAEAFSLKTDDLDFNHGIEITGITTIASYLTEGSLMVKYQEGLLGEDMVNTRRGLQNEIIRPHSFARHLAQGTLPNRHPNQPNLGRRGDLLRLPQKKAGSFSKKAPNSLGSASA